MTHFLVQTIKRHDNSILYEEYFCEDCWNDFKHRNGFQSDDRVQIRVIPVKQADCSECGGAK